MILQDLPKDRGQEHDVPGDRLLGHTELVSDRCLGTVGSQVDQDHDNRVTQAQHSFPSRPGAGASSTSSTRATRSSICSSRGTRAKVHVKTQLSIDRVVTVNCSGS